MQQQIAAVLGDDPTLYRRSINPDTGAITLHFHFPHVARERHVEALAALAATLHVPVHVHPHAHQEALTRLARRVLPPDLVWHGMAQVFQDTHLVVVPIGEQALDEAVKRAAQAAFHTQSGWTLHVRGTPPATPSADAPRDASVLAVSPGTTTMVSEAVAFARAQQHFPRKLTGLVRVGAHHDTVPSTLRLVFPFPEVARLQFAERVAALAEATGWQVIVHPITNQEQLVVAFKQALHANNVQRRGGMQIDVTTTTIVQMCVSVAGQAALEAAADQFKQQTGWTAQLTLIADATHGTDG